MSDFTPTLRHFRDVYGAMCAEWCRDNSLAEFDRMIAKVRADTLREAAEPFSSHADWLDDRAKQIEGEV